jgi:hypothetical protein
MSDLLLLAPSDRGEVVKIEIVSPASRVGKVRYLAGKAAG